jgi:hypothetical protein
MKVFMESFFYRTTPKKILLEPLREKDAKWLVS